MATSIQIVFDCAQPDRLAAFWASALRYKLQDPPKGFASWDAFLAAQGVPESERNLSSAIVDPDGKGPRIYFQKMDTPKREKNRLHIDINAGGGSNTSPAVQKKRVDTEVKRLIRLGASKLQGICEDGEYWVVMRDTEGNEFCVQ